MTSKKVNNFRLILNDKSLIPIIVGGMGVNISTARLALEMARLGGVGHISDAMTPFLSDKIFKTNYQSSKGRQYRDYKGKTVKEGLKWAYDICYRANRDYVSSTMEAKNGPGEVWINVMEKLTMGNPKETLKARLHGAMDGGVDGITLSAGLHTGSLALMCDHRRFRDVKIGTIVSSVRALKIFLRTAARVDRMPDYVVVEGPLAGGHLGYGPDWKSHSLKKITKEVIDFLAKEDLDIAVIPAGGIFTGTDAYEYLKMGASAVQVATRFTISQECGLPFNVKQTYLQSQEEDVEVNTTSPTGYPMRMLKSSPSLKSNQRPNCESLGYILDSKGQCQYLDAYEAAPVDASGKKMAVKDKMCICTHFMRYDCYTCGHYVYRLKDTTAKMENGLYYTPPARHIFEDYLYSTDSQITKPTDYDINLFYKSNYGLKEIKEPVIA